MSSSSKSPTSVSPNPEMRAVSAPIVDESPIPIQPTPLVGTRRQGGASPSLIGSGGGGPLGEDPSMWIERFVERCQSTRSSFCTSARDSAAAGSDVRGLISDTRQLLGHLTFRRQHLQRQLVGATKAKIVALGGKRPKGFLRLDTNANRVVLCPSMVEALEAIAVADRALGVAFPRAIAIIELMAISAVVRAIPKHTKYDGIVVCRDVSAVTSQAWLCVSKLLRSSHGRYIFDYRSFEPALTLWMRDTIRVVTQDSGNSQPHHASNGLINEVREATVRDTHALGQLFEYGSTRSSMRTSSMMKAVNCDTSLVDQQGSYAEEGDAAPLSALAYLQELQHTVATVRETVGDGVVGASSSDLLAIAAELYCADFAKYEAEVVGLLRGGVLPSDTNNTFHHGNVSDVTASPIQPSSSVPAHEEHNSGIEGPLQYDCHDEGGGEGEKRRSSNAGGGGGEALTINNTPSMSVVGRGTIMDGVDEVDGSGDEGGGGARSHSPVVVQAGQQPPASRPDAGPNHPNSNHPSSSLGSIVNHRPSPSPPIVQSVGSLGGELSPCARTLRPSDMLAALAAESAARNRFAFTGTNVGTVGNNTAESSPQLTPVRGSQRGAAEDERTPTQPSRVLTLGTPPPGVRTPLRSVMKPRFQTKSVDWEEDMAPPLRPQPADRSELLNTLDLFARPPQLVEFLSMCDSSAQEAQAAGRTTMPRDVTATPSNSVSRFHRPAELEAVSSTYLQERYYGGVLDDATMGGYIVEHMVKEVKTYYEAKASKLSSAIRDRQNYNAALAEDISKQRRHNALYEGALEFASKFVQSPPASSHVHHGHNQQSLVDRMTATISKYERSIQTNSTNRVRVSEGAADGPVLRHGSQLSTGLGSLSNFNAPPRPTMLDTPSANPVRSHTASPVLVPPHGAVPTSNGSPVFSWM